MSGPATVVVAGCLTAGIAWKSDDGLVADDYYKQGLAINRELAREQAARALGLGARVTFNPEHTAVRVAVTGEIGTAAPVLALVHPTLRGEDQVVQLTSLGGGLYEGVLRSPRGKVVRVRLEDASRRQWRISGTWKTREDVAALAP
jgi:hypothetical protein